MLRVFLEEKGFHRIHGVYINRRDTIPGIFEENYIQVRRNEGWLYSPEQVKKLPDVPGNDAHAFEWGIRKKSAAKLSAYLSGKDTSLQILDIGCGNGWLSGYLARNVPQAHLTAIDINLYELKQAAEAFDTFPITWIYGSVEDDILPGQFFDIILFAASIQYFPGISSIIEKISKHLKPGGEIHIVDTPFYRTKDIPAARKRTQDYYSRLQAPEMAKSYFHHSKDELKACGMLLKQMNKVARLPFLARMSLGFHFDYFPWFRLRS